MADQVYIPHYQAALDFTPLSDRLDQPWFSTVAENIRDAMFPSKQPPLRLTSKPVRVRGIWGDYNYKPSAGVLSLIAHGVMVAAVIWLSMATSRVIDKPKPHET